MVQRAQQWCDATPRNLPCLTQSWDGSEGHEGDAPSAWHRPCAPTLPSAGLSLQGAWGCAGQEDSATSSQLPPAALEFAPRCHPRVKPKRVPDKGGQL